MLNSFTIADAVPLVTAIAALMSAIAALFVVLQNKQQRTSSYRPELVLVRTAMTFRRASQGGPDWFRTSNEDDDRTISTTVPLVNIGLGAARNVTISWDFPIEELVSSVNQLAQRAQATWYYQLKGNGSTLSARPSGIVVFWHKSADKIDYVLPASIQLDLSQEVQIPIPYVHLIANYYALGIKADSTKGLDDPPVLKCHIEYSDIGGKEHKMDAEIVLEIIMFSENEVRVTVTSSQRQHPRRRPLRAA